MKSLCRLVLACALLWAGVPRALAQDDTGDAGSSSGSDTGSADQGAASGTDSGTSPATSPGTAAGSATNPGASGDDEGDEEGATTGDDVGPAARLGGDLGASIRSMIRLIEAKNYEGMINEFLDPKEKAQILKSTTIAELAADFGNGKAQELAKILKTLHSKIPQYTSDGATATFALDTSTDGVRDQIRFHKVDKHWYLKNH